MKYLADKKGFTLVELVIVIILTALLAVVLYNMADVTQDRAAAVARKLVADLRYAQQLANTTQSRSGVVLTNSITPNSYSVFTGNVSANTTTNPLIGGNSSFVVQMTGNFAGVGLTWSGISSGIIRFDSLGVPYQGTDGAQTPLAAAGTINVQEGATIVKTITIVPTTGQITMP